MAVPGMPAAFMSYARFDDQHDGGQLSQFRKRLEAEVQAQTGEEFAIFQDRNDIAWGQNWKQRIEEALDGVTLLLVIITPSLFRSRECLAEVKRFLDRERTLGRTDLILPVYYIGAREMKKDPLAQERDELTRVLASRQFADWRKLRFEPLDSPPARKAVEQLAIQIRDTLSRRVSLPPEGLRPPEAASRRSWGARIRAALPWMLASLLFGAVFGIGYGVRSGFAHGAFWGTVAAFGAAVVLCGAYAVGRDLWEWLRKLIGDAHSWQGWTASVLAAGSLTGGLALGHGSPPVRCPVPTELRVLTSAEDFAAIKNVIPYFERDTGQGYGCETVDVTAYASPGMSDTIKAFQAWSKDWPNLTPDSVIGPPPDVWIPDSPDGNVPSIPRVHPGVLTSPSRIPIGYTPVVIAVPAAVKPPAQKLSWKDLYAALTSDRLSLAVPDPNTSNAGLVGLAELHKQLNAADEHQVEAAGTFPQDSESLLCAAGQASRQGTADKTAYLASEAAVANYNYGQLAGAACGPSRSLPSAVGLTPVYPSPAVTLAFPFVMVKWPTWQSQAARDAAQKFYDWLAGPGQPLLDFGGVRPRGCAPGGIVPRQSPDSNGAQSCTTATDIRRLGALARAAFNVALVPAHVLIAVDDSGPMRPYLPQIAAALDGDLLSSAFGASDEFAIWELPGSGGQIKKELVGLEPSIAANLQLVPGRVGTFTAHGHSHNYDVLAAAASMLRDNGTGSGPTNSSVVLLTDGDGGSRLKAADVEELFQEDLNGRRPITLDIIAFGPPGCTSVMLQLANRTGGSCYAASESDPGQLLTQVLDQLVVGGRPHGG